MERGLNTSAKSIDPDQTAQTAQADLGRNLLLLVKFLHINGPYIPMIQWVFCLNYK